MAKHPTAISVSSDRTQVAAAWDEQQSFRAFNPGDSVPEGHPFGIRHGLVGKGGRHAVAQEVLHPRTCFRIRAARPACRASRRLHPPRTFLARYRRRVRFQRAAFRWLGFVWPARRAIRRQDGQHPRVTTEANIANFTRQIKSLGLQLRLVARTAPRPTPIISRWTQWIFLRLYNSWFNPKTNKAETD